MNKLKFVKEINPDRGISWNIFLYDKRVGKIQPSYKDWYLIYCDDGEDYRSSCNFKGTLKDAKKEWLRFFKDCLIERRDYFLNEIKNIFAILENTQRVYEEVFKYE